MVGLGVGVILGAVAGGGGLMPARAASEVVGTAILGGVAVGMPGAAQARAVGAIAQAVKTASD